MFRLWIAIFLIGVYQNTNAKQCSSPGKFPQDQAGNCGGYALCLMSGLNTFAQYNLTCPDGFIYNHVNHQCTNETSYNCVPDFPCTDIGHFPNPYSDNCTTYIACVEGLNEVMTARSIECPTDYIFSPISNACENATESSFKCFSEPSTEAPQAPSTEPAIHVLESTDNNAGDFISSQVFLVSFISMIMILLGIVT